ncbi:MAG TPA: hypothetical protein VKQ36_05840, partial [Ktedonobacterales bacterium]|nr:hypothetical protein [Ktedonobacterales bacterium]
MSQHFIESAASRSRSISASVVALALVTMLALTLSGCSAANALGRGKTSANTLTIHPVGSVIPAGPWVHEVAQTTTLYGYNTGPVTAACPQGQVALGGGWKVATQGVHVFAAYLVGNAWDVFASHTVYSRFIVPIVVTAYVECLSNDPGAIVTQFAMTTNVPANSMAIPVSVACDAGAGQAVAVGFDLGPVNSALEYQGGVIAVVTFGGITASYAVTNHDSIDHPITTYVDCLASPDAAFNYIAANGPPISAGMIADVQVTCPAGSVVAGGGFGYNEGTLSGNLYLEHANANGWEGAVYATSGSSSVTVPP